LNNSNSRSCSLAAVATGAGAWAIAGGATIGGGGGWVAQPASAANETEITSLRAIMLHLLSSRRAKGAGLFASAPS
jgi:hypothetical protein